MVNAYHAHNDSTTWTEKIMITNVENVLRLNRKSPEASTIPV